MLDAVAAEDGGPPAPTGDCRSDLRDLAHRSSHLPPASLDDLPRGRAPIAWTELPRAIEHARAALDPLGFDIDVVITIVDALQAFVRGYAIGELAQQEAVRRSGVGIQQGMDAHAPYLDKVVKSGRHPLLARVIRDAELPHAADRAERGFELGLERFLDGWEANLPVRP
ncbi:MULTISPECIES: TetR/AcrR family transcriptional regulator C-terminal domain-containing protein [Streptomyces]|uniref:TetR/AcrR family transcriptional regulator C-terminal domain-containing protein n=1 Tax=Streptomyces TaxID=1883 RepID=UPI001FD77F89|nr:TetR/AcrR family transcriptional regulator C-terminal domain-containing protein [Streptomyces durhamensis]